jgi:hypothetical protein
MFSVCIPFISAENNETDTNETIEIPNNSSYSIEMNIDKTRIQLGDIINIDGRVYENGNLVQDQINMIFYFNSVDNQNEIYLSVFDGTFSLSPRLKNLPSGTYDISVEMKDFNGNTLNYFENLRDLIIDNKLILDVSLDKTNLKPGDSLELLGSVQRNLDRKNIALGTVTVELDGNEQITEISNGNLDYSLVLDTNILSNKHDVIVRAQDAYGNFGEVTLELYIIPQQESLEIELEKKTYLPEEELLVGVSIYDQASEEIVEDIDIKLYNPKGKKIHEESLSSSSQFTYAFTEDALPGQWKVRVESLKLESEKFIEIPIVETLEIELASQTLNIRNSGNVRYTEILEILAVSEKHNKTITKRTNIKPDDSISIDLFKELKDLEYEIIVLNTNQTFNVKINDDRGFFAKTGDFFKAITGQAIHVPGSNDGNSASYVFGILVISLIILSTFFFKKKSFKIKPRRRRKPEKFQSKIIKTVIPEKTKEEKEIEDFKTRILKDIEKSKIKKEEKKEPFAVKPFFPIPQEPKKEEKAKRMSFDKPLTKDKW